MHQSGAVLELQEHGSHTPLCSAEPQTADGNIEILWILWTGTLTY